MFALFAAGGPFMWATLSTSLIALAIFLFKVVLLFGSGRQAPRLFTQTLALIAERDYAQALRLCSGSRSPVLKIACAALQRANRSEKEMRRAVEGVALEEVPKIKDGTVYLPQLSNLATLFGLIGTIHGLIISFSAAGSENIAARQAMLSKGISIAFYNTFFGLLVATVCVVLYLLLLVKTNSTMGYLEKAAAKVIDSILWSRSPQEPTNG